MAVLMPQATNAQIDLGTNLDATQNQPAVTLMGWVRIIDTFTSGADRRLITFSSNTVVGANRVSIGVQSIPTQMNITCAGRRLDADGLLSLVQPGAVALDPTVWRHVAVVMGWDSQFMGLYVDGSLVASQTPASWTGNSSNTPSLGARINGSPGGGERAGFAAHDVRLYRRAVSANEIKGIFTARGGDRVVLGLYNRWILNNGVPGAVVGSVRDYGPGGDTGVGQNGPAFWEGAPLLTRPKASLRGGG